MANKGNHKKVEELIEHAQMLLEMASAKLDDVKKAIRNPSFLKSAFKQKEMELSQKIDDILRVQQELRKQISK